MIMLPDRIRERRKAVGMTLAQLADKAGVQEATVQRWESGNIKNIKHETVEVIAEALSCSPVYLMGWSDDPLECVSCKSTATMDKIEKSATDIDDGLKEITSNFQALTADNRSKLLELSRLFLCAQRNTEGT